MTGSRTAASNIRAVNCKAMPGKGESGRRRRTTRSHEANRVAVMTTQIQLEKSSRIGGLYMRFGRDLWGGGPAAAETKTGSQKTHT